MIRRFSGTAFVVALMAVLALAGAGTASAHAARISADPAPDAAVSQGPARVSATFNEELQTSFAGMTVVGPDGNLWSTGAAEVQGAVASVGLRPLGPAGVGDRAHRRWRPGLAVRGRGRRDRRCRSVVGGTAAAVTRRRTVALGAAVVIVAAVSAWALAFPQNSLGDTLIRAVADCSAVLTLGLAVVPMFDTGRYRHEVAGRAAGPLIVASAAWAVAEVVRLLVTAAQASGVSALRVSVRTAAEFAVATTAGRAGLLCVVAAVVVGAVSTVASQVTTSRSGGWQPAIGVVVAGAAAVGLTGRSLVGHLSESPGGGLAVAVHALAAGLWCGTLAALVLVVEHRGQWARVLPRFSQVSLLCVVTLVVGGLAATAVTLHSPAEFVTTGYGRLLSAKVVLTVALTVLAWRNRTWWLPAARTHRATADVSRLRSRIELAGMAAALTLAAALTVTG